METHAIDARNKVLGRLATEVACLLRGKNRPDFDPQRGKQTRITVYNTDYIRVTGNKRRAKIYYRHSGYHGGLSAEGLGDLMERDSRQVLYRAVSGMLPKNNSRKRYLRWLLLIKKDLSE